MKTKSIKINGESLSYFDSEHGETALIFIHGAFINKEYWDNQLSHFSKDYRAIAVDLPGHGNSTQNRIEWTAQQYGKDISEFIQKLSLDNVILIGHSMGSDVMLEAVMHNPSNIIGLIEIDHMKNVGAELPQPVIDQLTMGLKANFASTCEQFAKQALITEATDPELVSRLLKDYRKMTPSVGTALLVNGFSYPTREVTLLKRLKLQLNLLHVNYAPTNEENLKKCLGDNYELHVISGTCHYPMLENPDTFNDSLNNILSSIDQDRF